MIIYGIILIIILISFLIYLNKLTVKNEIILVLGSGGHTQEMIYLTENFDFSIYNKINIIISKTDKHSKLKFSQSIKNKKINFIYYYIPRSREVGQNKFISTFSTIYSLFYTFFLIIKIGNIKLGIFNGPGVCLPVVLILKMFNIIGWKVKLIFFESFCRVNNLSLTGKLVYNIVDDFIVLWEQLVKKYPKSKYFGNIL